MTSDGRKTNNHASYHLQDVVEPQDLLGESLGLLGDGEAILAY